MHNRFAVAEVAVLAAAIVVGVMNVPAMEAQSTAAAAPRFEVASIKPAPREGADSKGLGDDVRTLPGGRLVAKGVLLRYLIQNAYGVKPFQISGGPAWSDSARYDIEAKAGGNPNNSQMRLMMQALLHDRFKLKVHQETKDFPVYELTVAKSGVKLQEPKQGSCISPEPNAPSTPVPGRPIPCGRVFIMMSSTSARMQGGKVSMKELVGALSNVLGQNVIDRTGFLETFDVHLEFTPEEASAGLSAPPHDPASDHGPIFAAIQEQLGLKLKSTKGPVDILIVDSVERPSAN